MTNETQKIGKMGLGHEKIYAGVSGSNSAYHGRCDQVRRAAGMAVYPAVAIESRDRPAHVLRRPDRPLVLYPDIFGMTTARMAYLFLTDDPAIDTYDPTSGENAVILQPGIFPGPVVARPTGPSLYREIYNPLQKQFQHVPCEFGVAFEPGEDPDRDWPEDPDRDWPEDPDRDWVVDDNTLERDAMEALRGNKIGGAPGFVQAPEYPDDGAWRLLLQVEEPLGLVPLFTLSFGGGVGYAFISADGTRAGFLWQR